MKTSLIHPEVSLIQEAHLLTQVEIDHTYGLLGMVIFVVLQHVWVACQTATAENKPPLLPCLQDEHRNNGDGYLGIRATTLHQPQVDFNHGH